MSNKVNVLSVMNDCRNDLDAAGMKVSAKELEKASSAFIEVIEALHMARKELAGLPHSLGYDFTHLPKIDAILSRVRGDQ